jgi:prevent-host-death family protein
MCYIMCVMSAKGEKVGIRELRQNLSVYVKRVREDGLAYEVTERGEPVARLAPLMEQPASTYDRLVAEGVVTPATGDLLEISPLPRLARQQVSDVLREMREEETW